MLGGTLIGLNSGGAAGSGPGCSPEEPDAANKASPEKPKDADKTAVSGQKSAAS